MAKRKSTTVEGYYRKGHYTDSHKRMLNDGMMLELAEGGDDGNRQLYIWGDDRNYYLVPDPSNRQKPKFVREDATYFMDDNQYHRFLAYIANYNDPKYLAFMANKRNQIISGYGLSEGTDVDWGEVVSIVDTVVGWFDSGKDEEGNPDSTNPNPNNFSIVGIGQFVVCVYTHPEGHLTAMGLNPVKKQLIAFSSPEELLKVFPNLPPWPASAFPKLPPQVPQVLIDMALHHPNKIITYVQGIGPNEEPELTVDDVVIEIDEETGEAEITEANQSSIGKLLFWGLGLFSLTKL